MSSQTAIQITRQNNIISDNSIIPRRVRERNDLIQRGINRSDSPEKD